LAISRFPARTALTASHGALKIEAPDAWPSPRYAWYFVTLLMLANAVAVLDRVVLGVLIQPMEHDLGIGDSRMGLLQGFAFSIFYGGLGIPIGMLADRWSRRDIVAIGVGLWLKAGDIVTTGTWIGKFPIAPHASIVANFEGFPPVEARLS
jgi:MFS family permease